jgi:hypothetical protein
VWRRYCQKFAKIASQTACALVAPPSVFLSLRIAALQIVAHVPELNPQENIWDEIREKIFKNYAAKSMDEVCEMLVEGSLYIERNPELVKSMTSFPYIASSI